MICLRKRQLIIFDILIIAFMVIGLFSGSHPWDVNAISTDIVQDNKEDVDAYLIEKDLSAHFNPGDNQVREKILLEPVEVEIPGQTDLERLTAEERESLSSIKKSDTDEGYIADPIKLDKKNYEKAVKIVFGEAGFEDFAGKCLVAQALRDAYTTMQENGEMKKFDTQKIINKYKYSGKTNYSDSFYKENEKEYKECEDAVRYILLEGNHAVQHKVLYFYAPKYAKGYWHETQDFIVAHGGHRFFDSKE